MRLYVVERFGSNWVSAGPRSPFAGRCALANTRAGRRCAGPAELDCRSTRRTPTRSRRHPSVFHAPRQHRPCRNGPTSLARDLPRRRVKGEETPAARKPRTMEKYAKHRATISSSGDTLGSGAAASLSSNRACSTRWSCSAKRVVDGSPSGFSSAGLARLSALASQLAALWLRWPREGGPLLWLYQPLAARGPANARSSWPARPAGAKPTRRTWWRPRLAPGW